MHKAFWILLFVVLPSHGFILQQGPALAHYGSKSALCQRGARCRWAGYAQGALRVTSQDVREVDVKVETVIDLIKDTDMGANATALPLEKRKALYDHLNALEASSAASGDLFGTGGDAVGMWTVDFVGETDAVNEVRQKTSSPAGGYWRGEIGRKIFRTEGLFQHVLEYEGANVPPYAKLGLQDAVRRKREAAKLADEVEMMKTEGAEWDGLYGTPSPLVLAQQRLKREGEGIGIRDNAQMQAKEFVAVNVVRVMLLNVLPISIVLVGIATRLSADACSALRRKSIESGRAGRMQGAEGGEGLSRSGGGGEQAALKAQLPPLTSNTVRVDFAPPLIAGGPLWLQALCKLSVGPCTDVFLDTTFANNRLRLGRGATSGSRFVFQKVAGDKSEMASSWAQLVDPTGPPPFPLRFLGAALKFALLTRVLATAAAFYLSDPITVKVICHGAEAVMAVVASVGASAKAVAISGVTEWITTLVLLLFSVAVSKSGGGIVRGEERSS